ncbi:hypothetical protein [Jannaschia sp. CCS1]|uniref:hypothetical protein n=1 Tax=Jannaschia sp. (strain CCS1) TaxID=290400 RepID=UPI000053AC23|nr:hypothetical protein [Jannaschia sp. CCS1]ABD53876.1 hypothetical protein Jann_0959 [Jannaschia sp. CCS1]
MPEPDLHPKRPGAFRGAALPVTLAAISVAAMGWLGWGFFETQREDVATTRAFLTHIAANEHAEAVRLMSPALAAQVNSAQLHRIFGDIEPWDHIGFSSRSTQTNGSERSTQLYGRGSSVSGCESELTIRLHNGLIDRFDVTPLCSRAGTDA